MERKQTKRNSQLVEAFQDLASGSYFVWTTSLTARQAAYEVIMTTMRPASAESGSFALKILNLIDLEASEATKEVLASHLCGFLVNVPKKQKRLWRISENFQPFYRQLVSVASKTQSSSLAALYIECGLLVASREQNRGCQDFFNFAVAAIKKHAEKKRGMTFISKIPYFCTELSRLVWKMPELVTPEYVEMHCHLLSLPLTHKETRQGSQEDVTLMGVRAGAAQHLERVIDDFKINRFKFSDAELFNADNVRILVDMCKTGDSYLQRKSFLIRQKLQDWCKQSGGVLARASTKDLAYILKEPERDAEEMRALRKMIYLCSLGR